MSWTSLPPALVLMLAGLLLPFLPRAARQAVSLIAPLGALGLVWAVPDGVSLSVPYLGYQLDLVEADALSRLFGTIFSLMAFVGCIFALPQRNVLELAAALIYAGGAVGVAFAGDLVSVFIFWELMAVASTLVVWAPGTPEARQAGLRYAFMHFLGGAVLMAGIAGHVAATGSTEFAAMSADTPATILILVGFLINAGAPPVSAWLPDAYPKASWSGTVFLSAFTTKTAVYVLLRGFPGTEILIWVGLYMVFYGIVYALLENNMRRILAYSIINQVGFMVVGIGIGTEVALNGAAAHAFAHIIYKALLLMSAGSVLYMTGLRKCTDLGGLFRTMPITTVCGTIGALAISAFPWTSGFVTKSMITQGAADQHLLWAWMLLQAASAGVFLHAGIKFPWFVFFQRDSGLRPKDPPWPMRAAMIVFAILCVGIGLMPGPLYAILPYPVDYEAYTGAHVITQLQLLLFSGLAFFMLLPLMKRTETITLDLDWFWRVGAPRLGEILRESVGGQWTLLVAGFRRWIERVMAWTARTHSLQGALGRTWPISASAVMVALFLLVYLMLFYLWPA
ncbi:Na(+)/H(+) antiporter subunit D [Roseospira marina]|uniref:Na(+)/H(+) antiporter subunit D n=1 Tax=Roseospira marina TaxID=140057 RepID=A0A5M6IIH9_9PROT|nr:Na(+)/H(+) antiporter subunit D [Roseospira marina]KAA5607388.1 Na(+)/H(+) antiporter subunit D [Roseospira marina]MBB4312441.1 multicomponent Na+:H+ antiporter subunit D [Roseospira marina]MBB5085543.1 multicomponent Na+:H+ antiporter subunit D [Roseospira marina]